MHFDIVLASASPRRRQLLEEAGVTFAVIEGDVDETLEPELLAQPEEAAKKLAERKAGAAVQYVLGTDYRGMMLVIGADTMVVNAGEIYGKPKNVDDGKRMLRALSGRTHEVHTAVSVWLVSAASEEDVSLGFRSFVDTTRVTFKDLSEDDIVEYLRKGESFDKAGAYGIQGEGANLVQGIEGSLDTVIGLPVERLLREFPEIAG